MARRLCRMNPDTSDNILKSGKILEQLFPNFGPLWKVSKKRNVFLGVYLSQMWVGGVADSQTRSKPLKTPPNCPENRLFRPKFHLLFSQISQKPWGGWVGKQIWERYPPQKTCFFWQLSLWALGIEKEKTGSGWPFLGRKLDLYIALGTALEKKRQRSSVRGCRETCSMKLCSCLT